MSFSQDVKNELLNRLDTSAHCRAAELAAIVNACGTYSLRAGHRMFLVLQSENRNPIDKAFRLIRRMYHVTPEISVLGGGSWVKSYVYTLAITEDETVKAILRDIKLMSSGGVLRDMEMPAAESLLERDCCRRAFLRGAFLSGGSISDPKKSYHIETVCENDEKADLLKKLLESYDVPARITHRKGRSVVYVKDSDMISEVLGIMGASKGVLAIENIRIIRDIMGNVNRQVNCETANLKKTVNTGVEQVRQIRLLEEHMGLENLPDDLRELAMARLDNPDMPLKDLGALLHPPIGKSGIYHRFERIKKLAQGFE